MNLVLMDAVRAWTAADELKKRPLRYDFALALVKVKRETQDDLTFYLEKERELALEYAETDGAGNLVMTGPGKFKVKEGMSLDEYERRRMELGDTPLARTPAKLTARAPESIEPEYLDALDLFIEFTEGAGT